mmetsp:Transcript_10236/g.21488  ORF Transcript_10236/g.21488 Transcript_10236/m.21488 type:complete len:234 (+) Transcript_10236:2511-3212(+)
MDEVRGDDTVVFYWSCADGRGKRSDSVVVLKPWRAQKKDKNAVLFGKSRGEWICVEPGGQYGVSLSYEEGGSEKEVLLTIVIDESNRVEYHSATISEKKRFSTLLHLSAGTRISVQTQLGDRLPRGTLRLDLTLAMKKRKRCIEWDEELRIAKSAEKSMKNSARRAGSDGDGNVSGGGEGERRSGANQDRSKRMKASPKPQASSSSGGPGSKRGSDNEMSESDSEWNFGFSSD